MEYQIISFDSLYNLLTVRFNDSVSRKPAEMVLSLPLDAAGNLPEGDYLDNYIKNHIPKAPETFKANNAEAIAKLVNPLPVDPDPVDLLPLAEKLRTIRNAKIGLEEWRVKRYVSQQALGVPTSDSEEDYKKVLQYIEDLRNITVQPGFPTDVTWPDEPFLSFMPITGNETVVYAGNNTFNVD